MTEYTPTDARRDAGRLISDNLFSVNLVQLSNRIWLNVIANNIDDAENKVRSWAISKGINFIYVTAYPTLNAIEETIV